MDGDQWAFAGPIGAKSVRSPTANVSAICTVPPLPAARVAAMRAALEKVSESIAAVQDIQMALALAARISQSASDMFDATATV